MSAAFGASAFADDLSPVLEGWGLDEGAAYWISFIGVTLVITYLSLVISELAPKRIAMQRAETFSLFAAPTLDRIAKLSRPVIWLRSKSGDVIVRAFGGDPQGGRDTISEEELRDIVAAHETLGREERQLIEDVFEAGEQQLHEVMVPRTEVDFLDASMPVYKAVKETATNPHSRYPVVRGTHDDIVGFIHVRDLFAPEVVGSNVRVGDIAREVAMLPGTKRVLAAMSEMRRAGQHLAIVVDEYGGTDGIVTLEDLMEEIIGEIHDEYDVNEDHTRALHGGDIEVDGLLNLEDFEDRTGLELPEGPYETLAGFVLNELGRLPEVGESIEALGQRFTVTELDGRRIARVRITAAAQPVATQATEATEAAEPDEDEQEAPRLAQ
jgi:putative hemolysin